MWGGSWVFLSDGSIKQPVLLSAVYRSFLQTKVILPRWVSLPKTKLPSQPFGPRSQEKPTISDMMLFLGKVYYCVLQYANSHSLLFSLGVYLKFKSTCLLIGCWRSTHRPKPISLTGKTWVPALLQWGSTGRLWWVALVRLSAKSMTLLLDFWTSASFMLSSCELIPPISR